MANFSDELYLPASRLAIVSLQTPTSGLVLLELILQVGGIFLDYK